MYKKKDSNFTALFHFLFVSYLGNNAYILSLGSFLTLGHSEFNTLAFFQIAITITNDGIKMDENIIA